MCCGQEGAFSSHSCLVGLLKIVSTKKSEKILKNSTICILWNAS